VLSNVSVITLKGAPLRSLLIIFFQNFQTKVIEAFVSHKIWRFLFVKCGDTCFFKISNLGGVPENMLCDVCIGYLLRMRFTELYNYAAALRL